MRLTLTDLERLGYKPSGVGVLSRTTHGGKNVPTGTQERLKGIPERDLHRQILDFCRMRGWPVVHSRLDVPQTAGVGTPDFVIAMGDGRTVWVEAKTSTGKLRPEQAAWLAALRHLGHRAEVVRSFEEFLAVTHDYNQPTKS